MSNIGSFMHSVGASWLMVALTAGSPLMIALIQTAMSLPMFLLALPAGALADLYDRRRLLIITQGWMLAVAAAMGALAFMDAISPWLLVILTFGLGVGSALNGPAWLAIDNDLVSQEELPDAITLDSMGFNVSRVVGPVLGGLIVAQAGPAWTFMLNAVSFLGVFVVIYRWRRPPVIVANERLATAMAAGWHIARQTQALRIVLLRLCLFLVGSSALWAFLPSAWYRLGGSPSGYGFILGCLGLGAVAGAIALPYLRVRVLLDRMLLGASLVFAAAMLVLALITLKVIVGLGMFGAGAAWLLTISSFNLAVQSAVPLWFRSRALAMYMLTLGGSMTAGSVSWGLISTHLGLTGTLIFATSVLVLGELAAVRYPLNSGEAPAA